MKRFICILSLVVISLTATAQQSTYVSASVYNTQNAMPFGKFSGLFESVLHPGMELGYGKDVWQKSKSFWFLELKFGLFYHRYVQYGIPLYLDFGYTHAIAGGVAIRSSVGAGYMHSIPAAEKFKLNSNGEYKNNKGIGRMQAIASFGIGLEYRLKSTASGQVVLFSNYQQRIQFPFVKSYVPLLPYNSFMIGMHLPVKKF